MNAPLRRVGVVLMVLFGLLFANLNRVQFFSADEYRNSPYNGRVQIAEYQRERGLILVGPDAQPVTGNEETDGRLRYRRTYPEGGLWAHVVGYKPVNGAPTGIEAFENDFLAGTSDKLFLDRFFDLFTDGSTPGGNVVTTLSRSAQEVAFAQLRDNRSGTNRGAVVALDPRTGAVQAMVSLPTFDPNGLASHDPDEVQALYEELDADPDRPLLNRAVAETFFPGSVFKVIVSAAALQRGYTPDTLIPAGPTYNPPQTTHVIANAAPSICPQAEVTLAVALRDSCNTGFARLGVTLGADALTSTAAEFGFGDEDLVVGRLGGDGFPVVGRSDGRGIPVAASQTGDLVRDDGEDDPATVALSSIGQASVRITPLQGAMIAATVANGGVQMRPYLVERLLDADLVPVYSASPQQLRRPVSAEVAAALRDMMVGVVTGGTGTNAAIPGVQVGGKTGTAEVGDGRPEHGWFIGFAIVDGEPVSAVAVLLENAGPGGSAEAARIAGQVLRAVVAERGGG
ncbi:MAG: penicillin-binding transpeptidase domain-containing protein [Micromonosporaceae bacterium]